MLVGCLMRAHDASHRALVGDRQRPVTQFARALEQLLRGGSAALEAEVGQAVEFGVGHGSVLEGRHGS